MTPQEHSSSYFVYILTNVDHSQFSVGVTGAFTDRLFYIERQALDRPDDENACTFLVYFEGLSDVKDAILREQKISGFSRSKKKLLINQFNPEWKKLNKLIYKQEHVGKIWKY